MADALTKSLSRERFWYLVGLLGLQQVQPQHDSVARIDHEAVRRALIAVLCLASVVPTTAQGREVARVRDNGGEDRIWAFWVLIIVVTVLAWEGIRLSLGRLQEWVCSRRSERHAGTRTIGTQTERESSPPVGTLDSGEGLRRRSPFHAGGAPTRVAEAVPKPPAIPKPPPVPDPPRSQPAVVHPPADAAPSTAASGIPDLPVGAPAPKAPTVPMPPPVFHDEIILTTAYGHCYHLPRCTQLVNTRAPGIRRPCRLCFPQGATRDTLARLNGVYGDPFLYHSIRRCRNEQGDSGWLTPCCHCLPDPDRHHRRG